jgi:predicted amidohydrolase
VDECIFNSQVVIGPDGALIAKYRKTHLFAATPTDEDKTCSPGDEMASFALGNLRFGLGICCDLRFPEFYRTLALRENVNVFILSSAWPFPRVEHFRILATARAIENQSYVIIANRIGTDDGVTFCGSSTIIDPYGIVLAAASTDRAELVVAEISDEVVLSTRKRMAVLLIGGRTSTTNIVLDLACARFRRRWM